MLNSSHLIHRSEAEPLAFSSLSVGSHTVYAAFGDIYSYPIYLYVCRYVHSIIYIHACVLSFVQNQPNSETKPFTYIIGMPQKLRALIYVFRSRSPVRTLILYPIFFYFLLLYIYACTYTYISQPHLLLTASLYQ